MMNRASCLCGGVRIRARLQPHTASHCHCSMCRKQHGAAFGSYANVAREELLFDQGEELLVTYRSSDIAERVFCGRCGSTLLYVSLDHAELPALALGVLDDAPETLPEAHIFYADRPAWSGPYDDGLPKYDGENGP